MKKLLPLLIGALLITSNIKAISIDANQLKSDAIMLYSVNKINEAQNEMQIVLSNSFPWYSNAANKFVIPQPNTRISFAFTMYDNFGFDIKN